MKRLLLIVSILMPLASCSDSAGPKPQTEVDSSKLKSSAEVYLARSSISTVEFEQFKLFQGKLYKECGLIKRGRFAPDTQDLASLPAEAALSLEQQISDLANYLKANKEAPPKAGTNKGFADPGQVNLSLDSEAGKFSVKTSVDAVSNAEIPLTRKIKRLVESMRGEAGGKLCGNTEFFGIAASKYAEESKG